MTARLGYIPAANEPNLLFKNQIVDNAPQSTAAATFRFNYGAFGAREHLENLHPYNGRPGGIRNGVISFAQRVRDGSGKPWREWTARAGSCAVDEAERLLRQDNRADLYVSQAAFGRWRSISDLTALGACYADLDYHNVPRWRGKAPADVAGAVLGHLEEAMLPHPSYNGGIVFKGATTSINAGCGVEAGPPVSSLRSRSARTCRSATSKRASARPLK